MSHLDRRTAEVIDLWLHGRSAATRDAYRRDALQFLRHAGARLVDVRLEHLQAWVDDMEDLAASSRARKVASVRSLMQFAHEEGHIDSNPGRKLSPPKVKDELAERILTEDEVARIIEGARRSSDSADHLVVRFLYASALRASELCALKRIDLQERGPARGQITVLGKGSKTRHVVIEGTVWKDLWARVREFESTARVFDMSRHQVYRIVRDAAGRAGIGKPVSPHWLRHAHASHALDRGAPVHLVQETLGHASLATTTRYSHARPDESSGRFLSV